MAVPPLGFSSDQKHMPFKCSFSGLVFLLVIFLFKMDPKHSTEKAPGVGGTELCDLFYVT